MRKKIVLYGMFMLLIVLTACSTAKKVSSTYTDAKLNEEGHIVVHKEDIDNTATYINYEVDGVVVQIIAIKGSDGFVRLAFNTCEVCYPSPNAYFIKREDYFECQNCGSRFQIDKLGSLSGGCNPKPVEEKIDEKDTITLSKEYVESFRELFLNWNGPTSA